MRTLLRKPEERFSFRAALPSRWTVASGTAIIAIVTLVFTLALPAGIVDTYDTVLLAALGAIGLNVLLGTSGQLSIGSSAFIGVGAFAAAATLKIGLPFPLDLVASIVAGGVIGAIVGLPGARLRGLEMALATLGAFFIIAYGLNEYANAYAGSGGGFTVDTVFAEHGRQVWAWILSGILVLVGLGAYRIMHGKWGRALRLIREHQTVAAAVGIPVVKYKLVIFTLSSALFGLEGGLMAHVSGFVSSDSYTLELSNAYIAMVILGGLDSVAGAVVGAAIVTALSPVVSGVLSTVAPTAGLTLQAPQMAAVIYGLLVLIILVRAPAGVTGWLRAMRKHMRRTGRGGDHAETYDKHLTHAREPSR